MFEPDNYPEEYFLNPPEPQLPDLTQAEIAGLRWLKYVTELGLSYDRFPKSILNASPIDQLLDKGLIAWGRRFDCAVLVLTPRGRTMAEKIPPGYSMPCECPKPFIPARGNR